MGAAVGNRDDVEVKRAQALLVQRKVDRTKLEFNAQLFQVARPGRDHTGAGFVAVQVLKHHGLAPGVAQLTALHRPARFAQQGLRAPQIAAQRAGAIGARRHQHGSKSGRRQLTAPGLHQPQFVRAGRARGRAVGVAKQALHTLVSVVEHLAVHPLVVHGQTQRLAHADIGQRGTARVQHITLKTRGQAVFELGLHQLTAVKPFAVDTARPVSG